jgi:hypothetical protein
VAAMRGNYEQRKYEWPWQYQEKLCNAFITVKAGDPVISYIYRVCHVPGG